MLPPPFFPFPKDIFLLSHKTRCHDATYQDETEVDFWKVVEPVLNTDASHQQCFVMNTGVADAHDMRNRVFGDCTAANARGSSFGL